MSDEETKPTETTITSSSDKKKSGWGGRREKVVVDELLTRQVASLLASGYNIRQVSKELKMSYTFASQLAYSPAVREMIKSVGEAALAEVKAVVRRGVANLTDLALEVLKEQLEKERSLEAVKLTFKVVGVLDDSPERDAGVTAIQVILPGDKKSEKEVEVEHDSSG